MSDRFVLRSYKWLPLMLILLNGIALADEPDAGPLNVQFHPLTPPAKAPASPNAATAATTVLIVNQSSEAITLLWCKGDGGLEEIFSLVDPASPANPANPIAPGASKLLSTSAGYVWVATVSVNMGRALKPIGYFVAAAQPTRVVIPASAVQQAAPQTGNLAGAANATSLVAVEYHALGPKDKGPSSPKAETASTTVLVVNQSLKTITLLWSKSDGTLEYVATLGPHSPSASITSGANTNLTTKAGCVWLAGVNSGPGSVRVIGYFVAAAQPGRVVIPTDAGDEATPPAVNQPANDYAAAIKKYSAAIAANPNDAPSRQQLAWLQATCPDARYRDGNAAVTIALEACELTMYKDYQCLDTLGAAYAEQGDFDNATLWQNLAINYAPDIKKAEVANRLTLYEQQKPYRQIPPPQGAKTGMVTPASTSAPPNAPIPLVAPFTPEVAQASQAEWSKSLNTATTLSNSLGMNLTLIPPGEFTMGSLDNEPGFENRPHPAESPPHRVRITRPFYLGTYELRKRDFAQFVNTTNFQTDAEKGGGGTGYFGITIVIPRPEFNWTNWGVNQSDDSPVVNVSWNDAVAFCQWLSQQEGKTYRLPTEAEWEYACRAGTETRYWSGDDDASLQQVANVSDASLQQYLPWLTNYEPWNDGFPFTCPVGKFQANAFGLYDMQGNAHEYCADSYAADYYGRSPVNDPPGPTVNDTRRLCRKAVRTARS